LYVVLEIGSRLHFVRVWCMHLQSVIYAY